MSDNQSNPTVIGKYKKFSDTEKRNYYKAFIKSGLAPTAFCRAHHISISSLAYWVKKFKNESNDGDFSPLMIKRNPHNPSANAAAQYKKDQHQSEILQLSISFNNNPMQLTVSMTSQHLALFIQEIGHATTIIR